MTPGAAERGAVGCAPLLPPRPEQAAAQCGCDTVHTIPSFYRSTIPSSRIALIRKCSVTKISSYAIVVRLCEAVGCNQQVRCFFQVLTEMCEDTRQRKFYGFRDAQGSMGSSWRRMAQPGSRGAAPLQ